MTATGASRESLREQAKLRLITVNESGAAVEDCPNGIYGFTCSPNSEGAPLFFNQPFQSFEVHKLSDGKVLFLGYMTDEDAQALATVSEPTELRLYPEAHEKAQKMVLVPHERIYRAKPASRDSGNWMAFVLTPK